MTGHLFFGGPAHLECRELPYETPAHWDVAVMEPEFLLDPGSEEFAAFMGTPPSYETFTYIPRRYAFPDQVGQEITVYVPEHMDEADQWQLFRIHGLGEIPEG